MRKVLLTEEWQLINRRNGRTKKNHYVMFYLPDIFYVIFRVHPLM